MRLSRRNFFASTFAGAAVLSAPSSSYGNPLGLPLGCQTYPVRERIGTDFIGTLKQLSAIGYQRIELCSPQGYADSGFAVVGKYKGPELARVLGSANLECHSCHFSMEELRADLPGRIEWAKSVGLTQMLVPSLDGPKNPTMDDVERVADEFSGMAKQVAAAGLVLGLHNEGFEVSHVDGKRTYDVLFGLLDPKTVKFQFQCSTISDGFVAADYFMRYPGRFISMHVQDWSPEQHKEVAVGTGSIDWKKTFAAAKVGGVQNYFVEMDFELMKESVPYLRRLKV